MKAGTLLNSTYITATATIAWRKSSRSWQNSMRMRPLRRRVAEVLRNRFGMKFESTRGLQLIPGCYENNPG